MYTETDQRAWLTVALEHGAKIHRRDPGIPCGGLYVVLDQRDSFLWDAYFNTPEAAARAYCRVKGLTWPALAASEAVLAEVARFNRDH